MRTKILILTAVLALAGASCDSAREMDDDVEAEPTSAVAEGEFTLTGLTIDALGGADPEDGFPEEADVDDEDGDGIGGLAVRAEDDLDAVGLDECDTVEDAWVVYYTPDTEFDPASVADDDAFPENLEGQNVTVRGEVHETGDADETDDAGTTASPDASGDNIPDDCVIVAEQVEVVEESADPDGADDGDVDGGTTAGSPSPDGATPGPTATGGEFPDAGIFEPEDPPSPDPCEGQKACRGEPGIGQPGGSV